uniref:HTH psq-type domain-containing protein n=1 Tax=Strigamia maritima TaxID=126957 RepID=T1IP21_STRMM
MNVTGGSNWPTLPTYKIWTKESMFTALKAVFARRMTYQQACDHFCIPVPTFYYYMSRVRKSLKPMEKEDYQPEGSCIAADQMNIKGRHGKTLNIAESDLNSAIMNVVCRSGKLSQFALPPDNNETGSTSNTPRMSNTTFSPMSPANEEGLSASTLSAVEVALPLLQGDEFMNRMNVKPRGRQRSWKQEDMFSAIKAIVTHQMSLAKASRQFGIPYPTLKVYLKKVASMAKPPEWADSETPSLPAGWTPPPLNTWASPQGATTLGPRPADAENSQKNEAYNRKLTISEVYSESTSDSSQDDDDEDEENHESNQKMVNPTFPPSSSITFEPIRPPIHEESGDSEPCSSRIPKVELMEGSSEDEDEDEDDDEAAAATRARVGGQQIPAMQNPSLNKGPEVPLPQEEMEEEHDNRPPWIEVLTLD